MARTVADQLIAQLIDAGVHRIYGIVGDSLNPVVDAVRRTGGSAKGGIDWIHVRNEEAAAFAAGAEAQLTGRLAVCAGSCGPGNLHLINGLFDAHRSGAPVLAIASHIPSIEIGSSYFQETHPDRLFVECSNYCELVSTAEQAPRVVNSAIRHATGLGGVAVVSLPGDVAELDAVGSAPAFVLPRTPAIVPRHCRRGGARRCDQRGEDRGDLRRRRRRGIARRGRGVRRPPRRSRGSHHPRQAVDPVRQPLRRGHDGPARLRRRPRRNPRRRAAHPSRNRLSLRAVPSRRREGRHRPDRRRRIAPRQEGERDARDPRRRRIHPRRPHTA